MGFQHVAGLLAPREGDEVVPACDPKVVETSHWDLRIGSVFIILVGSMIGALVPVALGRAQHKSVFKIAFFIAKYFGSGVILATAWMHLLSPAEEQLGNPCVAGILGDYDWATCIALMTIMVMFFVEILITHYYNKKLGVDDGHSHSADLFDNKYSGDLESSGAGLPGGETHLAHRNSHSSEDSYGEYAAQVTGLIILEFGVIFHSIFVGLTLAVAENFIVLLIVITFHQFFEGLGLGSRLATTKWPSDSRKWTPWILGSLYGITTPIAIAVGLGVKESLKDDPATTIVVNGVFDSISAGILVYTALVELLAHEFMFSSEMRKAPLKTVLAAYFCVAVGVALMALLAKWA